MTHLNRYLLCILLIGLIHADDEIDPPVIISQPEDTYTLIGSQVELKCKAEGLMPITINWFKDNKPVITHKDRPATAKITTHNEQLLINHFQADLEGNYYCNASNLYGSVASNAAVVKLAYIKEFTEPIRDTVVNVGDTIRLECVPPEGLPIPEVRWFKTNSTHNNVLVQSKRIFQESSGNLVISYAEKSDIGSYVCAAENIAGRRESKVGNVDVIRKPNFLRTPTDKTIHLGGSVTFHCQVEGDPEPTIIWKRKNNVPITSSRSKILSDKSLLIESVQQADMGEYICSASNSSLEASVRLNVKESPNFIRTPDDQNVTIGEDVKFSCVAKGEPKPLIRWIINGKDYICPEYNEDKLVIGRYTFSPDGTLIIAQVHKSDEGVYECRASQEAGAVKSSAKLNVFDPNVKLIPIIEVGPQLVNTSEGKTVTLNCKGRLLDPNNLEFSQITSQFDHNEMQPNYRLLTKWFIGKKAYNPGENNRIIAISPETLQINAITVDDQGTYECRLYAIDQYDNEGAYARASTNVIVSTVQNNGNYLEQRSLPEPPKSIHINYIGDTWIDLSWDESDDRSVKSYFVEYICYDEPQSWIIAHFNISTNRNVPIVSLKPSTGYLLAVRGLNNVGLGRPILTKKFIYTTKNIAISNLKKNELISLAQTIRISSIIALPISHSEVQLLWNVCSTKDLQDLISRFQITYHPRPISDCIKHRSFASSFCSPPNAFKDTIFDKNKYCSLSNYHSFDDAVLSSQVFSVSRLYDYNNMKTEKKLDLNPDDPRVQVVIDNLHPFVCYTFSVNAILKGDSAYSEVSQSNPVLTFESTPNEAPTNIVANWENNGSDLSVKWNHLNPSSTNGLLDGYIVRFLVQDSANNQTFSSYSNSYTLESPPHDKNFTVHIAPKTCTGEGVRSVGVDVKSWDLTFIESQRYSFFDKLFISDWPSTIWIMLIGCGIIFLSTLILIIIICYRRREQCDTCFTGGNRKMKKSSKFQHLPDNPMKGIVVGSAVGNGDFGHFQNQENNNLLMGNCYNKMLFDQQLNQNQQNSVVYAPNSKSPLALNKFSPTANGNYFPLVNQNNSTSISNPSSSLYTNQLIMDNSYADPSIMTTTTANKFSLTGALNQQFAMNSSGNSNTSRSHNSNPHQTSSQHLNNHSSCNNNQSQYYSHEMDDAASPYASTSVVNGPAGAGEEEFPGSNANQLRLTMLQKQTTFNELNIPPPPDSPPPPVPQAQFATYNNQPVHHNLQSETSNSSHGSVHSHAGQHPHPEFSRVPVPKNMLHNHPSTPNQSFMMTMNSPNQHHQHQSSFQAHNNLDTTPLNSTSNQSPYAIYQG